MWESHIHSHAFLVTMISLETEAERLANEGASLMRTDLPAARAKFARARSMFREAGDVSKTGALAVLIGRAWQRAGRMSSAFAWARRAVRDDPAGESPWWTLARFAEQIARAAAAHPEKRVRRRFFARVAVVGFAQAGDLAKDASRRDLLHGAARGVLELCR